MNMQERGPLPLLLLPAGNVPTYIVIRSIKIPKQGQPGSGKTAKNKMHSTWRVFRKGEWGSQRTKIMSIILEYGHGLENGYRFEKENCLQIFVAFIQFELLKYKAC